MRTAVALLFAFFGTLSLLAQGTISFQAVVDGTYALPPNLTTRTATGMFTLDSTTLFLSGGVFIPNYNDVSAVTMFLAPSANELGTSLFDFNPGGIAIHDHETGDGGGRLFNIQRTLSAGEASDLQAGRWWATVFTTPDFPNGEIRGQITSVHEPTVYALILLGAFTLLLTGRIPKQS